MAGNYQDRCNFGATGRAQKGRAPEPLTMGLGAHGAPLSNRNVSQIKEIPIANSRSREAPAPATPRKPEPVPVCTLKRLNAPWRYGDYT